jgi:hypothetical protein
MEGCLLVYNRYARGAAQNPRQPTSGAAGAFQSSESRFKISDFNSKLFFHLQLFEISDFIPSFPPAKTLYQSGLNKLGLQQVCYSLKIIACAECFGCTTRWSCVQSPLASSYRPGIGRQQAHNLAVDQSGGTFTDTDPYEAPRGRGSVTGDPRG